MVLVWCLVPRILGAGFRAYEPTALKVPHPHAGPEVDCSAPLSLSEWLLNSRCNDRILIRSGSILGGETRTRLAPHRPSTWVIIHMA